MIPENVQWFLRQVESELRSLSTNARKRHPDVKQVMSKSFLEPTFIYFHIKAAERATLRLRQIQSQDLPDVKEGKC